MPRSHNGSNNQIVPFIQNFIQNDLSEFLKTVPPNKNMYSVDKCLEKKINDIIMQTTPSFKKKLEYYEKKMYFHGLNKNNYLFLHGTPGTGKTHMASYIANKTNKYLTTFNLQNLKSKWIGQEPENLNMCLTEIDEKYSNDIVLFDEIDSIASARTQNSSGSNDRNACVNSLLTWLDGANTKNRSGLFIFTTNAAHILDNAFLDRMTYKIELTHISKEQLYSFLKTHYHYFQKHEIDKLASLDIKSFRVLNNIVKSSIMIAIRRGCDDIRFSDVMQAYEDVCKHEHDINRKLKTFCL